MSFRPSPGKYCRRPFDGGFPCDSWGRMVAFGTFACVALPAFGWEDTMPAFAHLPLLLKPEGNGKLSKRDGDRLGFPVFPLEWHDPKTGEVSSGYRESGYLPEAVINFLALLGWNPGNVRK